MDDPAQGEPVKAQVLPRSFLMQHAIDGPANDDDHGEEPDVHCGAIKHEIQNSYQPALMIWGDQHNPEKRKDHDDELLAQTEE